MPRTTRAGSGRRRRASDGVQTPEPPADKPPSEFDSYRDYLRHQLRHGSPRVSQRRLADDLGRSPAWISQILSGKRELDPFFVSGISRVLGLGDEDARAFAALVDLESPTLAVRRGAQAWLAAVRRLRRAQEVDDDYASLFSRWWYGAVLELARCKGFRADPEWISARLRPSVTVAEAREALDTLMELGLLVSDGNGVAIPASIVATPTVIPAGALSKVMAEWHASALARAEEALASTPTRERHHSSIVFALGSEAVPALLARLGQLERDILGWADLQAGGADQVYQLVQALYPVTEPVRD